MKISKTGLDLIKKYEGFESLPYLCPAKVPTIGYGATYYIGGTKVSMSDDAITKEEADDLLKRMVLRYENSVKKYVESELNQNQFDALISFTYNLGGGNLKKSTLLKKINKDPNDESIYFEFMKWNKAGGKILKGLSKRRAEEAKLYFNKQTCIA